MGLRTTTYALALKRARILRSRMEELMAELSLVTVKADAEMRIRAWIDRNIAYFENKLATCGASYLDGAEVAALGPEMAADTDALLRFVARTHHETTLRPAIGALLGGRQAQAREALGPAIAGVCADAGIEEANLASPVGPLIERVVLRGLATLFDERIALESEAILPIREATSASVAPIGPAQERPFLSHWPDFVASKLREEEWGSDMPDNAAASRKMFEGLVGNPPPSEISREVASRFRAGMLALPRHYDKSEPWRDLPLREIGDALEKRKADDRNFSVSMLSPGTANKHFTNLATYWTWCHDNGRGREKSVPKVEVETRPRSRRARGSARMASRPRKQALLLAGLVRLPVDSSPQPARAGNPSRRIVLGAAARPHDGRALR